MNIDINLIEKAFENNLKDVDVNKVSDAVENTLDSLDNGDIRVAENVNNEWKVNQWMKKAILLSFRINDINLLF